MVEVDKMFEFYSCNTFRNDNMTFSDEQPLYITITR